MGKYHNNEVKIKYTRNRSIISTVLVLSISICLCNGLNRTDNTINSYTPITTYMFNKSVISVPSEYVKVKTTNESVSSTFISTGNNLWDSLIRECLEKPSFSCIQKNVYTYLDGALKDTDMNVTNRLRFIKNKVDYRKYSEEQLSHVYENEITDDEIPGKTFLNKYSTFFLMRDGTL